MRSLLLVCALLVLSGCHSITVANVRDLGPEREFTFTAPENYQAVYRKVLGHERACFPISSLTTATNVQGDLYHDIKAGTVTVTPGSIQGIQVFRVVDVTAVDETHSKVVTRVNRGDLAEQATILKQWVLENSKDCDLKINAAK